MLRSFAFGDVFGDTDQPVDSAFLVADREGSVVDPAQRTVRTHDPVFLVVIARYLLSAHRPGHALTVFVVDTLEPNGRRSVQRLAGPPPKRLELGTNVFELS